MRVLRFLGRGRLYAGLFMVGILVGGLCFGSWFDTEHDWKRYSVRDVWVRGDFSLEAWGYLEGGDQPYVSYGALFFDTSRPYGDEVASAVLSLMGKVHYVRSD